ncbi:multifunctional procollagen lysine hydroxylase and glycosyltransferase LH3-like [Gigantopelta aegis]|uniref:multifunctional procollagen lysine hydroxylase and glycosyltransferase LH3-like n=1 Tax=Gigantopelta aegis TaxID=1735272 RepID=UPI001B88C969|nr:multifunctional procollagen lysine hydroxylase and glycosyltransferase LH3-like [Gigantopelta aegis]
MFWNFLPVVGLLVFFVPNPSESKSGNGLIVMTVATSETDGFKRFMASTKKYGLDVKVLGLGEKWDGGDVARYAGGGHKINLLINGLKKYKKKDKQLIMFVDSYDVVFTDGAPAILEKFVKFDARVLFSAEGFCWPDSKLAKDYPPVKITEKRFLNSGGFIGYASDLYEIVTHSKVNNKDDDQLYYTKIFLNESLRDKWAIKLDTRSDIFQNLNGALADTNIKFKGSHSYLYNLLSGTTPIVIHGNGPIKVEFNRMANYLADGWTQSSGCLSCQEDTISLEGLKESDYPTVVMALFVEHNTVFIEEYFQRISELNYPKDKIDVFIHNGMVRHTKDVSRFVEKNKDLYNSLNSIGPYDDIVESMARNWAVEECIKKSCNYLFVVDSDAQLVNQDTLQVLIQQNRTVIAPLLVRPAKLWSNFWGAIGDNGFYARSMDYHEIVELTKRGLWNVPFVSISYLIQGHRLKEMRDAFTEYDMDPDMSFCRLLREQGTFMFVTNQVHFGHQTNSDGYDTTHLHEELYQIFENELDWSNRYVHENYSRQLEAGYVNEQPCPDVFWFAMFTPQYCNQLVEEMENYGQWSGGKNKDPRLPGGYENVPTVDIHMRQIGMEKHWLHFLKVYIMPLQQKEFIGYFSDPPTALMNFVVRYRPDEQPFLRPHHDSSTYTINLALNRVNVDFEGGGCRFIRYNCSVTSLRQGWMFMHPGRLTHYHEGLHVTKGTRYIMVSFVDP